MSHPSDDDLGALDERARAAAQGLQAHVLERIDAERGLHDLGGGARGRSRVLAVAAAVLLITGTVAAVGQRGDGERSRVELDQSLELEPGVLRPLGPRDGKDSIQLPITAEPSTGLADGDTVVVAGTGFEPGEQVGIVQCAREAGGATPEVRGGIDGCYIGDVQYAYADEQGAAAGTYAVRRVLTTAITGTVDCAAEAERCIVAMGALNDYDRSGGMAISFADPGGEPIDIPTVTVEPSTGLADGDVVHLSARGLTPNSTVDVQVCSSDPSACWQAGPAEASEPATDLTIGEPGYFEYGYGLQVDADGALEADLRVWQFLPGPELGTYVDCAVSSCSLRISGETAPPTVPLAFTPGGQPPAPPAVAVEPTEGLAVGDVVTVQGNGFAPNTDVYVSLCAGPPGEAGMRYTCGSSQNGQIVTDGQGAFRTDFEIPSLDTEHMGEICDADGTCRLTEPGDVSCDGVETECAIVVDTEYSGLPSAAPTWQPVPVVVRFR